MNKNFIFSIIIPHKNIPDLLQRCLDSIPDRDDIQIIIVDDNSDPDKVNFESFSKLNKGNTEFYFPKEGKGAGYARNVGLKHAKGKWLIFADADDFFMPCFNDSLDLYANNENDIIYFRSTSVDSKTLEQQHRHKSWNNLLCKIQQTNNWNLAILIVPPWGKFIKHDLVKQNNFVFQEVPYSNDVLFSTQTTVSTSKKIISDDEIYCITYRSDSLTGNLTAKEAHMRIKVASEASLYLKKIGRKERYYMDIFGILYCVGLFRTDYKRGLSLTLGWCKYQNEHIKNAILSKFLSSFRRMRRKL
ncbi:MAG: glycosyltransferase [Candidatus Symbiothrix sp.]|jgi:glycosyltransferase involved in cell wall biosynthesis|nr:glycosyltransferase [Candidatus Symbiothrix sp.]